MKIFTIATLFVSSFSFAAEVKINQKDKKFDKTTITIEAGDSIIFHNDEKDITHNVFSLSPKNAFELKTQTPGSFSTVVFKDEGVTDVECAIHPSMKLTVTVKPKGK